MTDTFVTAAGSGDHWMKSPASMTNDEMNAAIATEVMGWCEDGTCPVYIGGTVKRTPGGPWERWSPATDIAAAFEVVERMQKIGFWYVINTPSEPHDSWYAEVLSSGAGAHFVCAENAFTLPRAICEAAVAAVRA